MIVVRGTKKFLDRVGKPDSAPPESSSRLGDWYATVWFWRPQVVLFVNATTLLPVLVPLAPAKSTLSRLPDDFDQVSAALHVIGPALEAEVEAMREQHLAKTASRSVLGIMNEFGHLADRYRWLEDDFDLMDVDLWLAQVPCSPLFGGEGSPDRELIVRFAG